MLVLFDPLVRQRKMMMNNDFSPNFCPTWFDRMRSRFFYSRMATGITIVSAFFIAVCLVFLFHWGVADAVFRPDAQACYAANGACWGFVAEKWRLIIFGRYSYVEQWRPALATCIIVGMLVLTAWPRMWKKTLSRWLLVGWLVAFFAFFTLMAGGLFGLQKIDSDSWGGLPLTVILTLLGMSVSVPIGITLALGRRCDMPLIRGLCTGYIEIVRGVPLITVLFVASFVFPLLLPSDVRIEPFWRVAWGIILFQAAYIAETVRGGLQTISKGQFLAANSLGLKTYQVYIYIILPQALAAVIPAFVNSLLSTFMDTSLVTVVSMFDLTGSLGLALGDAQWRDFFREGYIFIAAIYFVASFIMSRYSQWLEKRLQGNRRNSALSF